MLPYEVNNACKAGDLWQVGQWLDRGGSPNVHDGHNAPLHLAVDAGHVDVCRLLLARGADPNFHVPPSYGQSGTYSALHIAVRRGFVDICSLLLDHGANIQHQFGVPDQMTPLHTAVEARHLNVCRLLLDRGADIDARCGIYCMASPPQRYTPLHIAVSRGLVDICRLLLDRGADVHLRDDSYGTLPLHLAVEGKHLEVCRLLVERGAIPTLRDNYGRSAVDFAPSTPFLQILLNGPIQQESLEAARKQQEEARLRQQQEQELRQQQEREERIRREEAARQKQQQDEEERTRQQRQRQREQQEQIRRQEAARKQQQDDAERARLQQQKQQPAPCATDQLVKRLASGEEIDLIQFSSSYLRAITQEFAASQMIGEGSFGRVYANQERTLAIKKLAHDVDQVRRTFTAEVRVLEHMNHPHVVKLIGYCDADDALCLVYEHAARGSMDQVLQSDDHAKQLTWKRRLRALTGIAKALNYLHKHTVRPVYHRDVKSANIVLTDAYQAKLIDCGLSKCVDSETPLVGLQKTVYQPSVVGAFGTPGYLCPQYVQTMQYNAKAEIYSFGVTMLEVVTGRIQLVRGVNLIQDIIYTGTLASSFDERAGAWPSDVVETLTKLINDCTYDGRDYHKRISTMDTVMRQLMALDKEYCQETQDESTWRQQYEQLRAELTTLRIRQAQKDQLEQQARQRDERCCVVCFSDYPLAEGIECDSHHFLCEACLEGHTTAQLDMSMDVLEQQDGQIVCPRASRHATPRCEAPPFTDPDLARHVSNDVYLQYLAMRRTIWENAVNRYRDQLDEQRLRQGAPNSTQQERDRLREMLRREIPHGRMCGRCSFGPIDHFACYNLRTHHNESNRHGARINNACPQCGWFADEIALWPMWDGVLWEERVPEQ